MKLADCDQTQARCAGRNPTMLMGFPTTPFRLCDFWAIHDETMTDDSLRVRGALPGGTRAVALFRLQSGPRGSWMARSLEEIRT